MCVTAAVLVGLSGCGNSSTSAERDEDVAIHAAAIRWLLDDAGGPAALRHRTVYVDALDGVLPLDVQAALVERFDDVATIRFVDAATDEAIDTAEPGDPVRADGLLVRLGRVRTETDQRVRLYGERYRDVDHVVAYDLVLGRAGESWRVVSGPARVKVRPLQGAS